MAHLFSDFYKPVKGLVEEPFAAGKTKLIVKSKPNKDLDIEFKNEYAEGKPSGEFAWKQAFAHANQKYTVNGKLDIQGTFEAKAEVQCEGVTASATTKLYTEKPAVKADKEPENDHINVEVKYKHKHATTTVAVKKQKEQPWTVTASAVAAHAGLHIGGNAVLKCEGGETKVALDKYELGLRYDIDRLSFAGAYAAQKEIKFGLSHKTRDDLTLGGELKSDLKKEGKISFVTAVSKKIDNVSSVNASFSCLDGVATVAYNLKCEGDLETTFNVQTNLYKLDSSKLGATFVYAPAKKE